MSSPGVDDVHERHKIICSRTDVVFSCLAFVISISFALVKFYLLENDQNASALLHFSEVQQDVFDSVQKTFILAQTAPVVYANFLRTTYPSTTRQDFRSFSQTRPDLQFEYWSGISFVQRVNHTERAAWQTRAYQSPPLGQFTERNAAGAFAPASNRSQYFFVWFIEPIETNVVALGYDIGSETVVRLPAIKLALASQQATVTARLKLVQSTSDWGLLYLLPLQIRQTLAYQSTCMNWTHSTTVSVPITQLPATVAPSVCFPSGVWSSIDDPSYTFGFVSATLKPTILLQSALAGVNMPDVDVLLFDGATKAYQANFIGQSVHVAAPTAAEWNFDTLSSRGPQDFTGDQRASRDFSFGGRTFTVLVVARTGYFSGLATYLPALVLAISLLTAQMKTTFRLFYLLLFDRPQLKYLVGYLVSMCFASALSPRRQRAGSISGVSDNRDKVAEQDADNCSNKGSGSAATTTVSAAMAAATPTLTLQTHDDDALAVTTSPSASAAPLSPSTATAYAAVVSPKSPPRSYRSAGDQDTIRAAQSAFTLGANQVRSQDVVNTTKVGNGDGVPIRLQRTVSLQLGSGGGGSDGGVVRTTGGRQRVASTQHLPFSLLADSFLGFGITRRGSMLRVFGDADANDGSTSTAAQTPQSQSSGTDAFDSDDDNADLGNTIDSAEKSDTAVSGPASTGNASSIEMSAPIDLRHIALAPSADTAQPASAATGDAPPPQQISRKPTRKLPRHDSVLAAAAAAAAAGAAADAAGVAELHRMTTWQFCRAVILPHNRLEWVTSTLFTFVGIGVAIFKYWLAVTSETTYAVTAFHSLAQNAAVAMRQELRLVALVPQLTLNFFLTDADAVKNNGRFHWLLSAQSTSLEAFAPDLIVAPAVTNAAQRLAYEAQMRIAESPSFTFRQPIAAALTGQTRPPLYTSMIAGGNASALYAPASNRPLYAPVIAWDPDTDAANLGVDLGSRADWAAALQAAAKAGAARSTPRLWLSAGEADGEDDFGELLALPMYANVDAACVYAPGGTQVPAWCIEQASAMGIAGGAAFPLSNTTFFSANLTRGFSATGSVDGANATAPQWIGHVVAVLRWEQVLKYGLTGIPLVDVDVALYNAPSSATPNASLYGFTAAEALAADYDAAATFLAVFTGTSTPGATLGAPLSVAALARAPETAATSTTAHDLVESQTLVFGGRPRVLHIVARAGYLKARSTTVPVWILLLSLAATNLKDFAVAVVLLARFWCARRFVNGDDNGASADTSTDATPNK